MMRMSLFLVWTVLLACSGVSSTGTFVGEAMENRLKLLERKYGMHANAQKPKKKGTRKKKTRINCKEQPLKPVCMSAKLKKLEAQADTILGNETQKFQTLKGTIGIDSFEGELKMQERNSMG